MFLLILILPFLGFLFSGLFGRFFGRNLSPLFSSLTIFITFIISIFAFYEVSLSKSILSIKLFNWIIYETTTITFGLLFDSLTCIMLIIVSGISCLVHLYSIGYMSHDPHISRFMSYLSLFTFFMLVLVISVIYVQMFIGCEVD